MRPLGPRQRRGWPGGARRAAAHPDARAELNGRGDKGRAPTADSSEETLSLIHISEPTRLALI
eukprot:10165464-Alexandrium_andersonii.AAC.1